MLTYLSGPMSGIEGFNYAAFNKAAKRLRELGFDVLNPAETAGGVTHLPRQTFMAIDIGYVQAADAVVVMEGWRNSPGAKLEVILATNLGKPVFTYDPQAGIGTQVIVEDWAVQSQEVPVEIRSKDPEPEEDDPKIIPLFSPHPEGVH